MDIAHNVIEFIDKTIKESWLYDIRSDYFNSSILLEDTLKNSFYYHIRTKLTDQYMNEHNLRLYTELHTSNNERIDLALVKIDPTIKGHIRDIIVEYIAVIELKYKAGHVSTNPFYKDIEKIHSYIKGKEHSNCQYYIGFIHETSYDMSEDKWLYEKDQTTWAKGKVTELTAFYNEEEMKFLINSYNDINIDLNHNLLPSS